MFEQSSQKVLSLSSYQKKKTKTNEIQVCIGKIED